METNLSVIKIDDKLSIHFVYVPEGYAISELTLDNHETQVIGRLKQLNRIKSMKSWKKEGGDLVKLFTDALLKLGWDFEAFPNPVAYVTYYHG